MTCRPCTTVLCPLGPPSPLCLGVRVLTACGDTKCTVYSDMRPMCFRVPRCTSYTALRHGLYKAFSSPETSKCGKREERVLTCFRVGLRTLHHKLPKPREDDVTYAIEATQGLPLHLPCGQYAFLIFTFSPPAAPASQHSRPHLRSTSVE